MKTSQETKAVLSSYGFINPLINERRDTTQVSLALQFIAKTFVEADPGGVELSLDECGGLADLLLVCTAALDAMSRSGGKEEWEP